MILGSTRDPEIFGELKGYQIHSQIAFDILKERYIRPAHAGLALPGIAAAALLGCFFEHQDPAGRVFTGRIRRREGGVSGAYHDHIAIPHAP